MVDLGDSVVGRDTVPSGRASAADPPVAAPTIAVPPAPPTVVADRRSVLVAAFRRPGLRRLGITFAGFRTAEMGAWIALNTVAYEQGGVREAAAVMVAQLLPATFFALSVSWLADRLGVRRVLVGGLVVQTACLVSMGALLVAGAPVVAVYACAVVGTMAVVTTLPTLSTLLPSVVANPHELTAANSLVGWLDGAAVLLGPLLTAAALAASGRAAPFFVFAVLTTTAAVAGRLAVPADRPAARAATPGTGDAPGSPSWAVSPAGAGASPVATPPGLDETLVDEVEAQRSRGLGPVLVALGSWGFLVGALDLLYVVVAIDVTGGPPQRAALLNVAFGVGAVVGGTASALLIGIRRLWPVVAGSAVLAAGTLVGLAMSGAPGTAAFAFGLCGVAAAALFVAARTLLHRVSDLRTLCRAFSLVEAANSAMLLLGALAVPLFVDTLGPRWAALAVGAIVAGSVLVVVPNMARGERVSFVPPERVAQLQAAELFSFLPAATLETLAREARPLSVPAGTVVLRQGADGHRFYVVVSGSATVTRDGTELRRLGPGSGFGEMALLLDAPRSATVTMISDCELVAIDRAAFLVAVTGHDVTSEQAERLVSSYD